MISIVETFFEQLQTGSTLLAKGEQKEMKAYKDASPKNDKLDSQITKNKFSGKNEGKIDQNAAPPNPEVAHLYVNTPLMRITKTRI